MSPVDQVSLKQIPKGSGNMRAPSSSAGFSVVVVVEVVVVTFLVSFLVNHIFTMFVIDVD